MLLLPVFLAIATIVALVTTNYQGEPVRKTVRVEQELDGPPPPELMVARFGGEKLATRRPPSAPLAANIATANWQELGPLNMTDPGATAILEPSQGRINAVAGDAQNAQHLYAAGASGGVWVTTDGGTTWSPRAQTLPLITVSSIVVDQANGNVVYIATGDADGRVTPSIGVYKSTDGGTTWNATGLTFQATDQIYIPKLAIDPTNGANVYAVASDGVYYTKNGGTNWTKVQPSGAPQSYRDIKVRPGIASSVYAVADNAGFFRSVDGGLNWQPATGVPDPFAARRAVIGVTAADASVVYLLAALVAGGADDLVIYKSNDGGGTFAQVPSPTLKEFAANQATFFDLALAVSPTNANELMGGVVSVFRSVDGGASWFYTSAGPTATANPIVHVDQHAIEYINNAIYVGSDGGLHRTTDGGLSWPNLSPTLGVGQIYQISGSRQNPALIFVGEQDNGFNRYLAGKWEHFNAGDFGRVAVDPTNDQVIYASANFAFFKYTDINGIPTTMNVTAEGKRFEGAPVVINPNNPQIVYAGYQNLFRTTNGGGAWQNITNFAADGLNVDVIALAPSDPKIIYLARSNGFGNSKVYRSPDDGATFNDISAGLPAVVTGVAVDPANPLRVWASLQGGNTNAVHFSQNGGGTWTNFSGTSLPNSSTRAIVYETGSQDGLYVGTVAGVYFRDSTMADWAPYNTNLPNVVVSSLEIDYNSRKLRAGTYGRGLWQTDLATRSTAAKAQLLNISTRLSVSTGTNVSIAGFIVAGVDAEKVIVRGMGPSLAVTGKLADPTLELHDATKMLLANDNWKDTQEAEIQASTIPPTNNLESAIVATVPSNNSNYTAILAGKGGGTGVGLVEVYDLAQTANARLANISTRGFVDTGDNVMIGGLILGPGGVGASRIVFRAIGPSLTNFGVPNALADPTIDLRDQNGNSLATNDDWKSTQQAEIQAAGLAPANDAESALVQVLAPGNYTAIVRGKGAATGTALVEAYNLQ